jgi:hypothetical protein
MNRSLRTPRADHSADDGFALLTVLGSMAVITMFLLSSLAYALHNAKPSRDDQDGKAALAAAQAGIDEYLSRLTADDTYYTNNGNDPSNPAFGAGVPIYGTDGAGASFRYQLLTTDVETAASGIIRLLATGESGTERRSLTATLSPDGFLKYIYFTDIEAGDPALYRGLQVRHNGDLHRWVSVSGLGQTKKIKYTWYAKDTMLDTVCKTHYYAGRYAGVYTTGAYVEVGTGYKSDGVTLTGYVSTEDKQADAANKITLGCLEITFTANDVINGPLHSNDALQITGLTTFAKRAGTSWGTGSLLPPPTDGKLWWGDKTLTLPGTNPVFSPVIQMPTSNDALRKKANPLSPDFGPGCMYTGQTRITFIGTMMKVLSPGTTSSVPACYNTASPDVEQTVAIPPVIYVQDGPCGAVGVGYPRTDIGEDPTKTWTTTYDCSYGTAFVSGSLSGRVTIGTSRDIVVTGNTTYQGGMTGSDALGLIPQGFAWVYHPVKSDNTNALPYAEAVRQIDAAILSVGHSFIAQNFFRGAALSSSTDESSKLRVRGSIIQKHRGPVGSPETSAGYLKNYIYDARLLNAPPPYFLRPLSAPWQVVNVTD